MSCTHIMSLHLTNISKWYTSPLFQNCSMSFHAWQKIAIVWPNGCGKSTFLRIVAGIESSDTWWIGKKWLFIHYREQDVQLPNISVLDFLSQTIDHRQEYKIYDMVDRLDLTVDLGNSCQSLSWWEKQKVRLCSFLLQEADVRLFDEPTNHMDTKSVEIVSEHIRGFGWICLFVSHDRHFINQTATHILQINKDCRLYTWNYDAFKTQQQLERDQAYQEWKRLEKTKKKREQRLATMRQRASVAPSPALWRLIRHKQKFVERDIYGSDIEKPHIEKNATFVLDWWKHKAKHLYTFQKKSIWHDWMSLIENVHFWVYGKDRIRISWPNWSWKSTLLKAILHHVDNKNIQAADQQQQTLKYAYLSQHSAIIDETLDVRTRITKQRQHLLSETDIYNMTANIWLDQHLHVKVAELSYGQKVKLQCLCLTETPCDVLILDEPTNHLDIPTRESIEHMLEGYEWSLLLVSHDTYFCEQINCNKVYDIQNKRLCLIYETLL